MSTIDTKQQRVEEQRQVQHIARDQRRRDDQAARDRWLEEQALLAEEQQREEETREQEMRDQQRQQEEEQRQRDWSVAPHVAALAIATPAIAVVGASAAHQAHEQITRPGAEGGVR